MKKYALVGTGVFIFALVVGIFMYQSKTPATVSIQQIPTVTVGTTTIVVDIATTSVARAQGLSGRGSLAWGQGMLFVFPKEEYWGFWMKDMQFAIDIIWANEEGIINTVLSSASPDTYPQKFYPTAPALYVLEVPAGYAAAQGIGVGQKIVVQYKERVE